MKLLKNRTIALLSISLFLPAIVFGHGDHHDEMKSKEMVSNQTVHAYETINSEYIKSIKPIIEKKCFDCHGNTTQYPWYYKVPGIKQMIDYDVKEAKKHLDMSKNFPFISHATPLKDLESIKKVTIEGDMPPLRYVLGHWDSRLSESEKQTIVTWSKNSIATLKGVHNE
ncbi:MAG: heme-binding domain-containing protein [Sulfuricurvum sp.]|uniref:heme-binding domain-containing protein n=1 Tax=Sulfuricurvum sp. TaxID=2025608 RepID=UPI002611C7D3|nr:heme-binding domain-containing protein [Sulfuricurvum sp.]MDD5160764.1 heme-binding domain-containing protein [Sulfuricurvum sp.]